MADVLIVDDNLAFAENLGEILQDAGLTAEVVGAGSGALERIAARSFDLLVSDMKMPSMGGAELVHRARRIDPGLPAVVVTAYTNDDELRIAREEGLLAVLPKPAPIVRLVELARTARRDGLVALVEDDTSFSDNIAEALRGRGFSAVTATSVTETDRLGAVRPFAAIVDMRVPGGPDGEAAMRLLRRFPGLPIVVATAYASTLPVRPVAVFEKPFDTRALLDVLDRLHQARHAP